MKKFYGFQLIKLLRAVNANTGNEDTIFAYEVEHYNVFGEKNTKILKIRQIDRDWDKIRMTGEYRHAVLEGGVVRKISQVEYNELTYKYDEVSA